MHPWRCSQKSSRALPLLLLALLLGGAQSCSAARILMYPYPWPSCVFGLVVLAGELSHRGHDVLVVTPREMGTRIGAMLQGELAASASVGDGGSSRSSGSVAQLQYDSVSMDELRKVGDVGLVEIVKMTAEFLFTSCTAIFDNQTAVDALYEFKADIFVGDAITACSWIISDILGLPRIDYNPGAGGGAVEAALYRLSLPSLAYTPVFTSGLPPTGMTLPQRAINVLLMGVTRSFSVLLPIKSHLDMRRHVNTTWRNQNIPAPNPHRALLTLSAVDVGVEQPRPVPVHVKYVGPLTAQPPQPLSPDLEAFVSGAPGAGAIVASFGTMLNASPSNLLAIARAFAALPQRVVWKVRNSDLTADARRELEAVAAAAGNIRMLPWIPQQDLLGHPAVKVFLTHGGIHSIYEALFHGQPMVIMPLGIDQFDNARLVAEHHRAGCIVQQQTLAHGHTTELVAALQQVVDEPSYRQRAQRISKRLRSQPGTPATRAADWVEYALATGPEPFLWPLEVGMPWWRLNFVDLGAVAAAGLAASCAAAFWCVHACRRPSMGRSAASAGVPPAAQHPKSA